MVDLRQPSGAVFQTDNRVNTAIGPEDEVFVLYSTVAGCGAGTCAGVKCSGGCDVTWSVALYTPDGALDPGFGVGAGSGLQVHSGRFGEAEVAVGADGRPVIAVYAENESEVLVARFDRAGHLDPSFGVGGVSPLALQTFSGTRPRLAVLPDGDIALAVEGSDTVLGPEGRADLLLARLLPNGFPDPGFGNSGLASVPLAEGTQARPTRLAYGSAGTLSVGVSLCCRGFGAGPGVTFARLLPNGGLDPSFGLGGQAEIVGPGENSIEAFAAGPAGVLYAVLLQPTGQVAIRLRGDGSLDPAFGGDGVVSLDRVLPELVDDAAVDSRGRLVVLAGRGIGVSVLRMRPGGGVDRTFAAGGAARIELDGDNEAGLDLGLQSADRIVVLGESNLVATPIRTTLARLLGGDSRVRCLGKRATIVGTREDEEIIGTRHPDVIAALGGRDTVRGLGGADLICGGKGRDRLYGGAGRDDLKR